MMRHSPMAPVLGLCRDPFKGLTEALRVVVVLSLVGCANGCNPQERIARVPVAGHLIEFRSLESLGRTRMEVPGEQDFYMRHYRALWDKGANRGQELVVLSATGSGLFGDVYQVQVFDRHGCKLRDGFVTTWRGQFPYCLVEVNASCDVLPEEYRNRWILAVGFIDAGRPFNPAKPIDLRGGVHAPENAAALVDVEPVIWRGDYYGGTFKQGGVGMLHDCSNIRSRLAERVLEGHAYRSLGDRVGAGG